MITTMCVCMHDEILSCDGISSCDDILSHDGVLSYDGILSCYDESYAIVYHFIMHLNMMLIVMNSGY